MVQAVQTNPLVLDYIKSESRGLAMALPTLGMVVGELILVTLFGVTRSLNMNQ